MLVSKLLAMKINQKLTKVIGGRTIKFVSKEEGLVVIAFDDYSTMRLRVAGGPTINMLGEGKIESALEEGAELALVAEDGRTAILAIAEPGSSISVRDQDGQVRYEG
jgi:hypothetical protein